MNRSDLYFAFILSSLTLLLASSCKKDKHGKSNACRIVAVYDTTYSNATSSATANLFFYDNNGRISSIKYSYLTGSESQNFTYGPNLTLGVWIRPLYAADSIFFNSKGLPERLVALSQDFVARISTYIYNANGQIQTSIDSFRYTSGSTPIGTRTTYSYVYSNGDLLSKTDNSGTVYSYTYYTDKAAADGDCLRLSDLMNLGTVFFRNAHLVKSQQLGSRVQNYSYTFDNTGKIATATTTDEDGSSKYTIQYDCSW